jgi:hypothetical protein
MTMTTYRATISEVQSVVADVCGIPREALKSNCRKRVWAWPRQEAMFLARELTGHSYPSIARHFGDRDHTTCLYADRKIRAREETDHHLAARLDECRARIADLVSQRIGNLLTVPTGASSDWTPTPPQPARLPTSKRIATAIDQADWLDLGGEIAA